MIINKHRMMSISYELVSEYLFEAVNVQISLAALNTLRASFIYKENQLFIGASMGISIFPEDGIDEDILIKNADLAMYEAKRNGGNKYKIYSSKMKKDDL